MKYEVKEKEVSQKVMEHHFVFTDDELDRLGDALDCVNVTKLVKKCQCPPADITMKLVDSIKMKRTVK